MIDKETLQRVLDRILTIDFPAAGGGYFRWDDGKVGKDKCLRVWQGAKPPRSDLLLEFRNLVPALGEVVSHFWEEEGIIAGHERIRRRYYSALTTWRTPTATKSRDLVFADTVSREFLLSGLDIFQTSQVEALLMTIETILRELEN